MGCKYNQPTAIEGCCNGDGYRQYCNGVFPTGDNCKNSHYNAQYRAGSTGNRCPDVSKDVRIIACPISTLLPGRCEP
jgi:hypothetical protein